MDFKDLYNEPSEEDFEELTNIEAIKGRMSHIRHKLVIMSGKGGVGKTTVTVNLAQALALKGYKVGILDADITGPNVPKMLGIKPMPPNVTPAGIFPAEIGDISLISMALLMPTEESAVIWRGPLIMGMIEQFLADVVWGELDHLIVDLPPGTGDETLSIMQFLKDDMDGVITVTTPQEVALLDARKGIVMSREMGVRVIGIIENMSGLVCPHCGEKINLFKAGNGEKLAKEYGVPFLGRIPLDPRIVETSDNGTPFVLKHDSPSSKAFIEIVQKIEEIIE
jgi:Mrp family chromosome partitioning ATPase